MKPKISIVIPFYFGMKNWQFFLTRCLESIEKQTFKDYEAVLIKHSTMPVTSNRTIQSAKGEIVKILYMDDCLAHKDVLQNLYDNFRGGWFVSGCLHDSGDGILYNPHYPEWNENIIKGHNTIGSPSVVAFKNDEPLLFDENLSWMLDVELYHRLYKKYGEPTYQNSLDIIIGTGDHQTTHILTDEEKLNEVNHLKQKYGN